VVTIFPIVSPGFTIPFLVDPLTPWREHFYQRRGGAEGRERVGARENRDRKREDKRLRKRSRGYERVQK
jgi:hypothetical protein